MNIVRNVSLIAGLILAGTTMVNAQSGPVAGSCQSEIEKFCAGMSHELRQIRSCLEDHREQVSAVCKDALDSAGPRMGAGRNIILQGQIADDLRSQGFTEISSFERKRRGVYEVRAIDPDGYRVELYVDGMTGEIIKSEREY